jgi:hypothetical protein
MPTKREIYDRIIPRCCQQCRHHKLNMEDIMNPKGPISKMDFCRLRIQLPVKKQSCKRQDKIFYCI